MSEPRRGLQPCLGHEPTTFSVGPVKVFDRKAAQDTALARLASIGVNLTDMYRPLADLSGGQRQSVSISRVVSDEVRILILDEPTAALGVHQTRQVVELIRDLAAAGAAVILVTHDIEIVRELADHYVILNRGRLVADTRAAAMTPQKAGPPHGWTRGRRRTRPGAPSARDDREPRKVHTLKRA